MDNCNLLDLSTTGGRFTWHRNHNGICILSEKLDRSLANVDWRITFPEAFVKVLCRLHYDHNPLLLRFGGLPLARGQDPSILRLPGLIIMNMRTWLANLGTPPTIIPFPP